MVTLLCAENDRAGSRSTSRVLETSVGRVATVASASVDVVVHVAVAVNDHVNPHVA
jgi:hypothetical protein